MREIQREIIAIGTAAVSIGNPTELSAAICLMQHASAVLEAARSTQYAAVANAAT